jgi:hypothetical protein
MLKVLEDDDLRNVDCAFRFVDKDLERGVGKVTIVTTESVSLTPLSSILDSERIE